MPTTPLDCASQVITIIIEATLLSLRLNPTVPPLAGGRFGIHASALIVIAVRSNGNVPIGKVTELLWLDWFYIVQFATIFISLVENAIVHTLIRRDRATDALRIDLVFSNLLPFVMYPCCQIGLIIWALIPSVEIGLALVACGIILPILGGLTRVHLVKQSFEAEKKWLAKKLAEVAWDANDEPLDSDDPLLREVFDLYDIDHSGDIDEHEVRSLLHAMYPRMPKAHRKACKKLLAGATEGKGNVTFDRFDDIILQWRRYVSENDPEKYWSQMMPTTVLQRRISVTKHQLATATAGSHESQTHSSI